MARQPYARHAPGLAAIYAEVEKHALAQEEVLAGSPGSIAIRRNANGTRYYVRQFYEIDGRKG